MHGVIDDQPVGVVDDLRLVAELDGLAESSFADRSGVGFMERHEPGGSRRLVALHPGAGLVDDSHGAFDEHREILEHATDAPPASLVVQGVRRFGHRCGGEVGELAGDHQDLRFGFVAAASQPHPDRVLTEREPRWCGR